MISEHACNAVAQAYELFETFYLNILTEYFKYRPDHPLMGQLKSKKSSKGIDEIRVILKMNKEKNNKGLLSITRKLSPSFAKFESTNIYDTNVAVMFDFISTVRHILVHGRQQVNIEMIDYLLSPKGVKLFNMFFHLKTFHGRQKIYLTREGASDIIGWFNGFAHLIFKCISEDEGLSSEVPQYH